MDRLTLTSSSVVARRNPAPFRTALLILALSFVVFLLTRGASASVTEPRPSAAPMPVTVLDDASVLPWAAPYIQIPRHEARMHCNGHSARPRLHSVHPCADVYDAELHVHAVAGSLQPE